ncbi:hypothetical protein D3C74_295200 [compost metagenome]
MPDARPEWFQGANGVIGLILERYARISLLPLPTLYPVPLRLLDAGCVRNVQTDVTVRCCLPQDSSLVPSALPAFPR